MSPAIAHILGEAEQLSVPERAELADRIVESLAHEIPADIAQAQLTEVRRRIAQVEADEVTMIPGAEPLTLVHQLVQAAH